MSLHRISGWFVCHDAKYSGLAECVVERDVEPTAAEAEPLLWPVAAAQLDRMFPGEGPPDGPAWLVDFTSVTVREA
jgi:hypothetical protein